MFKKEILWRDILFRAREQKEFEFTQKELAQKFGFSLSTVFHALKIPRQTGAIQVKGRSFTVLDVEKFLYLWATQRNIEKEKIFETFFPYSVKEIEGMMPPKILFACYSAYAKKYKTAPADYDKVYIYADKESFQEIKRRFPHQKGRPNFFVFKSDPYLSDFGGTTPDIQTFADIWNLKDWYAKDFLTALKEKLFP